jgi:hypothetical protein
MARQLSARFQPKLQKGHAIAGICLIRLEHVRPRHLPAAVGIASENAAHRTAVIWMDADGKPHQGVFIARRDTGSLLNQMAGGRIFPGEHHHARFDVEDTGNAVDLQMRSDDGSVRVEVRGHTGEGLPATSCFDNLEQASRFFEGGAVGYSVTSDPHRLDGLRLATQRWSVEPLAIDHVFSSYFSDEERFPKGSVQLDCALLMRDIEHEWHEEHELYV